MAIEKKSILANREATKKAMIATQRPLPEKFAARSNVRSSVKSNVRSSVKSNVRSNRSF